MKKKQQKIQIFLILIGLVLIIGTYFYNPFLKKNKIAKDESDLIEMEKAAESESKDAGTSFKNVEYKGFNLDNPFIIRSEEAYVLNENEPHILNMINMHLILYLKDGGQVDIISNEGRFNRQSHDAFFKNNVKAVETPGNTVIHALNLLSSSNLAQIYNNVNLINEEGSFLKADSIEYDFEQKKLKISMFDEERIKMKVVSN